MVSSPHFAYVPYGQEHYADDPTTPADRYDYDPDDDEPHYADEQEYELYYAENEPPRTNRMSHAEAGRLGGLATLAKYGREYFAALAKRGGEAYNLKYVATGLRAGRTNTPTKDTTSDELPY